MTSQLAGSKLLSAKGASTHQAWTATGAPRNAAVRRLDPFVWKHMIAVRAVLTPCGRWYCFPRREPPHLCSHEAVQEQSHSEDKEKNEPPEEARSHQRCQQYAQSHGSL